LKTPIRLSHSAKDKYVSCSEKYRLHYIEKLRGPKIYSSLFFGSALDEAFSRLLLDKKRDKTPEEMEQLQFSAEDIFHKHMQLVEHNGKTVEVAKSPYADYYTSDFEPTLLTSEALSLLQNYAPDVSDVPAFMEACKNTIKAKRKLVQDDLALYNYVTWLTLFEKGLLMVEAYRTQVMPEIEEVFAIQKEITITNEFGDSITGKIDFIASFNAEPGTKYICDNKSSSKPYKANSVLESEQLATYCEAEGTTKAAYVVVEKKIYKKAPIIHTEIIKSDIPEATFAHTFAQYEGVLYSISTGVFEKNFKSCFEYGRMCSFYALCKHGNSDGLVCTKKAPVVEEENV
jgi:hypothetical protein